MINAIHGDAARLVKHSIRALIGSRASLRAVRALGRSKAACFMLHRFADPALGNHGIAREALRAVLQDLGKKGVTFMSLRELARRIDVREPLPGPTALFTVDDGYRDFATVAAPVFAEFDCPVTVFMLSEFVDGRGWCWWDRVFAAFGASTLPDVTIDCGDKHYRFALPDARSRSTAAAMLSEALKRVPNAERLRVLAALGTQLDVEVPERPTDRYAAMTWTDARRLEGAGIEFAPHSRTHPILNRLSDDEAREEIAGSWEDVQRECANPAPVFCYPNGALPFFGDREMQLVEQAGLRAAAAVYEGYIAPTRSAPADRFRLPRFPFSSDPTKVAYITSGLARTDPRAMTDLS